MRVQSQRKKRSPRPHFPHHRLMTVIICGSLIALAALLISYFNWQGTEIVKMHEAQISSTTAIMDQKIAKIKEDRKLQQARDAEIAAKKAQEASLAQIRQAPAIALPTSTTNCGVKDPGSITAVINKKNCFNPVNFAPPNIVSFDGYPMREEASTQLRAMLTKAMTVGITFSPSSAYRSYDNQKTTYQHWVSVNGSQQAADTVSARPGFSEHQTGLAVDLKVGGCALECFGGTDTYRWLQQHAAEFGFVERYPAGMTAITGYTPESWHWRYVGPETALDMKKKGISTLEMYFDIPGGDYS